MTTEQKSVLIFQDQAGEYYALPQESLERGRVPAEHKAEVESLLDEADGDVSGYIVATAYGLIGAINTGAKAMGEFTADAALAAWLEQKLISGGPA